MNKLTVIENELVPVYETSTGEKVVYGSELYEVLEVKSKFADWIKNRFNDCEAIENQDFEAFSKFLENGGRRIEYIIKLDIAKEMAMLERNDIGKRVRKYFIEIEKRYNEPKQRKSTATKKQKTLASVNNAAKIILPSLKAANLDPVQVTYFLKNLYEPVGIDIPMIRVEHDKMYDQTAIAETLGVYSKSGKPHAQAIGAILSKICIDENDIIRTSYARNGHTGTSLQYKEPVLKQVEDWLATNGYPTVVQHYGKSLQITYKEIFV